MAAASRRRRPGASRYTELRRALKVLHDLEAERGPLQRRAHRRVGAVRTDHELGLRLDQRAVRLQESDAARLAALLDAQALVIEFALDAALSCGTHAKLGYPSRRQVDVAERHRRAEWNGARRRAQNYAALQRDTLELPAVDVELLERIKGTLCERDAVGRRVVSALPV